LHIWQELGTAAFEKIFCIFEKDFEKSFEKSQKSA